MKETVNPASETEGGADGGAAQPWQCYVLRCADGTLYCGVTLHMAERLCAHNAGRGAKYTRGRGPCVLVLARPFPDRPSAMRAEWRVKKTAAPRKVRLLDDLARLAWG